MSFVIKSFFQMNTMRYTKTSSLFGDWILWTFNKFMSTSNPNSTLTPLAKNPPSTRSEVLKTSFREGAEQLISLSEELLDLLADIQTKLPPFRATFSPHDNPSRLNDYGVLSNVLQATSTNTPKFQLPPRQEKLHWLSAWSPDSPARKMVQFDLDGTTLFIR
ncbi:hypothetical protein K435DRAFT_943175 [Dendrothele bispora CBS 962.96]|uniref:Uncharacterized protein n=1 Tax=Dendrothele bispora (strain CBS 962.96) TaxID=1314807 RepID=A0A4S8M8F2_DENBC|nr:hypothetical protein K435DRAFT_943175 [Dendrothele bispora CBS 962.96]